MSLAEREVVTMLPSEASMLDIVIESSPDLNAVMTREGVYLWVTPSGRGHFGWDPKDLAGKSQDDPCHPDDAPLLRDSRLAVMAGDGAVTISFRFKCPNGEYRWAESISRRVERNGQVMIVSALRDTEHRKASELVLQQQAMSDPLTGIANRTVFMDRLRQALKRLERHEGLVSILFLDLDRFKVINDSMGHRMGDGVLQAWRNDYSR